MPLTYRLIQAPSEATREMLARRMGLRKDEPVPGSWGAVLLVQGQVADLFAAVDLGTKAAPVAAREVWGNCPQHITTVAFLGTQADVRQVLSALKSDGVLA